MKLLADEPSSMTVAAEGIESERRLTRLLDTELVDAVTLHDRKVPATRGSLDHLVVAPSGIWLIDAMRDAGEVECRSTGTFGSGEPRLFVDGRNQTRWVHAMGWHVAAVRAQLDTIGFGEVPVHPVVCFTSSRSAARGLPVRRARRVGDVAVRAGGDDRRTRPPRHPADRSGGRPSDLVTGGMRSTGDAPGSRAVTTGEVPAGHSPTRHRE